jgi:hypothetical protein
MQKTCFKCKRELALTEFYVHPAMGDGRLNKCKECTRRDVSENYRANIDHYVNYERSRQQMPERRASQRAYARNRPPEKRRATIATSNAIRDGRLVRQPCEVCGAEQVEAHHDDYSRPLDVRWLCRRHHLEHHGKELRSA